MTPTTALDAVPTIRPPSGGIGSLVLWVLVASILAVPGALIGAQSVSAAPPGPGPSAVIPVPVPRSRLQSLWRPDRFARVDLSDLVMPRSGSWIGRARVEDARRIVSARPQALARARLAAIQEQERHAGFWWLPWLGIAPLCALAARLAWIWLCGRERVRLSRRGLAITTDPVTGMVLLHRPDHLPTTRIIRDRRRERAVLAAARAIPTATSNRRDAALEAKALDRIRDKHQETTRRRLRPRTASPRPRLVRVDHRDDLLQEVAIVRPGRTASITG